MSDVSVPAVVFDGVWKKFRRGESHNSLRDLVPSLVKKGFRRKVQDGLEAQEFWALKDVSFEVPRGQALGIIGPNGAGKSTTLKLLTRILKPTKGRCRVTGRVGALIEVAAGFHGDLTGRENIFLQGAIMGMKRNEIARKLDEIIEFAGVRPFIDTQVKRYSTGMNARLGFAVAVHLDPDVLIIDEVLGVGDMAFQTRCIERMHEFKKQGVSIVFVSHNLQAVSMLCDRVLFVKNETVALAGTEEVLQLYSKDAQRAVQSDGVGDVVLESVSLETGGADSEQLQPCAPLALQVSYRFKKELQDLTFGILVHRSTDLLIVYDAHFSSEELGIRRVVNGDRVTIEFSLVANLLRGLYHVECHVYHNPTQVYLARFAPVATFGVQEFRSKSGIADLAVSARTLDARPAAPPEEMIAGAKAVTTR